MFAIACSSHILKLVSIVSCQGGQRERASLIMGLNGREQGCMQPIEPTTTICSDTQDASDSLPKREAWLASDSNMAWREYPHRWTSKHTLLSQRRRINSIPFYILVRTPVSEGPTRNSSFTFSLYWAQRKSGPLPRESLQGFCQLGFKNDTQLINFAGNISLAKS